MKLNITKYSKIEEKQLWVDGKIKFKSDEEKTRKVFKSIYQHLDIQYPKFHKMDKLCKLGFLASEALLQNQNLQNQYLPEEIALILCNSNSTINIDTVYYNSIKNKNDYFPSPALFVYTLPNIVIGEIAIRHIFRGEIGFLIQQKFNAEMLVKYLEDIFLDATTKACITGWVDINEKNDYKTVLFLVEKDNFSNDNITFDVQNLETLFN